jgi:poly(hydroxyalkanoate) granule-associated protein
MRHSPQKGNEMATKRKSRKTAATAQERMLGTLHEVWLAGLGAVSKAQRGAPQLLEDLVSEGARVHSETRGAAEKAVRELLGGVQSTINARVGQVRGQAADALENLEKIFQTRVHRALTQLGVPSAEEIASLSKRVDALNANIGKLARERKSAVKPRPNAMRKPASHARAHAS